MHLNDYLGSLADLWPAIKLQEGELVLEDEDGPSEISPMELNPPPSSGGEAAAATTTAKVIPPQPLQQRRQRRRQPLSLRDGLEAAGVGKSMMGVADAGCASMKHRLSRRKRTCNTNVVTRLHDMTPSFAHASPRQFLQCW